MPFEMHFWRQLCLDRSPLTLTGASWRPLFMSRTATYKSHDGALPDSSPFLLSFLDS